jgi:N-acetylglucosaminyl-diphospho-decaprenol L-rhamnosyltransferase
MTAAGGPAVRCAIVIVNYQGEAFVADAVRSALAQTARAAAPDAFPVVVVDNASTDRSREVLAPFGGEITLVASAENTGFAGGNNLAFARFPAADAYALLNPDAVADPDWLAELLACAARRPDWGMIGAHIRDAAAPGVIDNVGHRMGLDGTVRGRGRGERDRGQYGDERPLLIASGCAMLLRGEAVRQAGGFDGQFFCYCDDVELCLRLNLLGYTGYFAPAAKVAHRFSATAPHPFSPFKAYQVERNRYWVIAKCFPWPVIPVALVATAGRYLWAAVATARGRGPAARLAEAAGVSETARTLWRAHRDALRGLPAVLGRRRAEAGRRRLGTLAFIRRWRRDYLPLRIAVNLE